MENKFVKIMLYDFGDYMGEQFLPTNEVVFNETLFTASELTAMEIVAKTFIKDTVNEIVNKSHEEQAWSDNVDQFKKIDYNYGFDLRYPG
jgi:hypothetical protein